MTRIVRLLAASLLAAGLLIGGAAAPAAALQPYVFLLQWGSSGSGNGHLTAATDGAVDSAGNVYVVDQSLGRIQKFTPTGGFIKAWTRGCAKLCPDFSSPRSITAGNGVVWLADTGNSRLVKMDTNGVQSVVVPTPATGQPGHFGQPFGIDMDGAGNVYVVSGAGSDLVQEFNASGGYLRTFDTNFSLGNGAVAAGQNSNVYVFGAQGTSPRVTVFDRFGHVLSTFTPLGSVGQPGIDVDSQGRIYVSDTSATINVYSLQGQLLGSFGTPARARSSSAARRSPCPMPSGSCTWSTPATTASRRSPRRRA